jgi:uncharacterized protein (TIGR00290 family)
VRDVWLWWSSGKDSAWALHELRLSGRYRVTRLVTSLNGEADRVAMHAVRRSLLERQARAVGVPLETIALPQPCSNREYQQAVAPVLANAAAGGVSCMAFGDLFLEDVRRYRVDLLDGTGIEPVFPIWGRDTHALASEMIASGLRAHVTCVDPKAVPPELAGLPFDRSFLDRLPPTADPCGENGEFHTFAWDGPMFADPIAVVPGAVVEREGFVYADLAPAGLDEAVASTSSSEEQR